MRKEAILEALLFISDKPLSLRELSEVLAEDKEKIDGYLKNLAEEYRKREAGIKIIKVAGGFKMCANSQYEEWIKKLSRQRNKKTLSKASLETLAIIAYRQPITRLEIEEIRGVDSTGVITHLLELELITTQGKKEVPGRPFLYVTTKKFLEHFGLNSLDDLPDLEEFSKLSKELSGGER
ncbi:MAG: SMC-Scp complex subunit ScpB [Candidatus Omnitrophica bacterium 4484_70.2]|nr:MAG: SMC-Scp complex subunit ScpB [Candidatus Omnitrophica bacterium 4484_70.2]